MDIKTGNIIKGYQLMDRIGEGGFGIVYRAFQPVIEREVVVKAILPIYANNPAFIRNFEAEAQLIARLEHMHIVPLYDYWRDPTGAYLVMRLLRGGSLLESLRSGGWDIHLSAQLLEQIASALSIAHSNNIVHQDIKPANILLDNLKNAYLTDFGIAKDMNTSVNLAQGEDDNIVHGSPAYVAPEQIIRGEITTKADIYSLGIVIYELLTGKHPFEGASLMQMLRHQLNSPMPPLHISQPELPEELNTVLWRATAKVPESRYNCVTDMAREFREIVNKFAPIKATSTTSDTPSNGLRQITAVIDLSTTTINPYKGLRSFEEADSADFFGRGQLIENIIARISDNHFLAVVGPSGSGKSSAVKAGVIPTLRKRKHAPWVNTLIIQMTPGNNPIANLESALLSIATNSTQVDFNILSNNPDSLNDVVCKLLPDQDDELLIVIDQFEEVFTQTTNEADHQYFLKLLSGGVQGPASKLRIIVTLRADFYDRPLMYADIGDLIKQNTEVVLPLNKEELKEAIAGPASRAGLLFESGLVELIIDDVEKQPNALPLLQHTLTELYQRRDNLKLTIKAYQASGGIAGSLARRADQIYTKMNDAQKHTTREIFLRLVTLGEGTEDTRRRVFRAELNATSIDKSIMQDILEAFGKYRLLTFDHDPDSRAPTVEIAHEALIRRWEQLRTWLNENRDDLRLQRKLATITQDWIRAGKNQDYLATGTRLVQLEPILETQIISLSEDERNYIEQSIAKRITARRRRQALIATLIFITVFAMISALIAIQQRNATGRARDIAVQERDRADEQAHISRSRELASSALVNIDQIDLPLLLSLQALQIADTFEARNSLLTTLQTQPHLLGFLNQHTDIVRAVTYSPDGNLLATTGRDNTIIIWDAETRLPISVPLVGHEDWINVLTFSPDGSLLVSADHSGQIRLWNTPTLQSSNIVINNIEAEIFSLAFSPDGQYFASGSADGIINLWDPTTGEIVATLEGHQDIVYNLAFNPDSNLLASGSADNTIRLWDMSTINAETINYTELSEHTNWVFALAFHPNGRILVSGSADNTIIFWDTQLGEALTQPLRAHQGWIRDLVFTANGESLITAGADGLILVWDMRTTQVVDGFMNINNQAVRDIALHPNNHTLATVGDENYTLVWDLNSTPRFGQALYTHEEQILAIDVSHDSQIIASGGGLEDNFVIRLWNIETNTLLHTLDAHTNTVTSLAFSYNSDYLATASVDQRVIIWEVATGEVVQTIEANSSIFSLAFSETENTLAFGDNAGNISIWHIDNSTNTWQPIMEAFSAHNNRITSLSVNNDSTILASGSRDNTIKLWDMRTGQQIGNTLGGHTDGILAIAFNPDSTLLASGGRDTTIRIWDIASGTQIRTLPTNDTSWILSLAFTPDGLTLASGASNNYIMLWDVETNRTYGLPFIGHTNWVNNLIFSPDGHYLYSAGRDGQIIQWSINITDWEIVACQIINRTFTAQEIIQHLQGEGNSTPCTE